MKKKFIKILNIQGWEQILHDAYKRCDDWEIKDFYTRKKSRKLKVGYYEWHLKMVKRLTDGV